MSNDPYSVSSVRKGLLHFLGGRIAQAIARALLLLLLVRLLPLADYGAYMLVVGLSETMLRLASFGIVPVGQRFLPQLASQCSSASTNYFCMSLIGLQWIALLVVVVLVGQYWPQVSPLFGFNAVQTTATSGALALLVLIPAFRFATELLEALLEQGRAQGTRALMPTIRLLAILVFLASGHKPNLSDILLIDIAVTALCLVIAYLLLISSLKKQRTSSHTPIPLTDCFKHARDMAFVDVLGAFNSPGTIRIVLASSIGLSASGLFAFLQSVERLVSRYLPGTLLRGMIRPLMVDRYLKPGGVQWVSAGMNLLIKLNLIIVMAAILFASYYGDQMVSILSGDKFSSAGFTLLIMLLALAASSQQNIVEMVMQVTHQTSVLRNTAILTPTVLLLISFGITSTLNTSIILLAIATASAIVIQLKRLSSATELKLLSTTQSCKVLVSALLAALLAYPALEYSNAFSQALLAILLFGLFLFFAKPVHQREHELINRALGKRIGAFILPFTQRTASL